MTSLALTEGSLPTHIEWSGSAWEMVEALQPYAVLDGEGEAIRQRRRPSAVEHCRTSLPEHAAGAPRTQREPATTGRLFVPKADLSGMVALKFKVDAASAAKPEFEARVLQGQGAATIAVCASGTSPAARGFAIRKPRPQRRAAPRARRDLTNPASIRAGAGPGTTAMIQPMTSSAAAAP